MAKKISNKDYIDEIRGVIAYIIGKLRTDIISDEEADMLVKRLINPHNPGFDWSELNGGEIE